MFQFKENSGECRITDKSVVNHYSGNDKTTSSAYKKLSQLKLEKQKTTVNQKLKVRFILSCSPSLTNF